MTDMVNVQVAKTHLSQLLARVERGDEIVISRGGVPVARLISVGQPGPRELGFVHVAIPASFDGPLPEDELEAWN